MKNPTWEDPFVLLESLQSSTNLMQWIWKLNVHSPTPLSSPLTGSRPHLPHTHKINSNNIWVYNFSGWHTINIWVTDEFYSRQTSTTNICGVHKPLLTHISIVTVKTRQELIRQLCVQVILYVYLSFLENTISFSLGTCPTQSDQNLFIQNKTNFNT